jgi:hypothetical protein
LAQKLGQLQPFIAAFPQECMSQPASFGPTGHLSRCPVHPAGVPRPLPPHRAESARLPRPPPEQQLRVRGLARVRGARWEVDGCGGGGLPQGGELRCVWDFSAPLLESLSEKRLFFFFFPGQRS